MSIVGTETVSEHEVLIQPTDLYHPGTLCSSFRDRWNLAVCGSPGHASVLWNEKDIIGQRFYCLGNEEPSLLLFSFGIAEQVL